MVRVMVVFGGGDEGGGPAYLKSYIKGIDKKRFEIIYVSLGRDTLAEELADNLAAAEVFRGRRGSMLGAVASLRSAIERYKPDVIHTHGLRANFAGRLAGRARGVPVVTTVHSAISRDYANPVKGFLAMAIDDFTLPFVDKFIVVSRAIKADLITRGVPSEKITVVYNGIDASSEPSSMTEARSELGLSLQSFVVGTVARLEPNKGISYLIKAASVLKPKIANLKVVIIGSGRDKHKLERESEKLGVSDIVQFAGFRNNARRLMPAFDVFALPSLMEGFALAVIEAMAAGVPVVASKVGGVPEIVRDGENGFLVEPANPHSLADMILKLSSSPDTRKEIAEAARRTFLKRFTTERFVAETATVLEEVKKRRV